MQFFDYKALKKGFNKTAKTYDQHAELALSIGNTLIERLRDIKIKPKRILDIGAGTSNLSQSLKKLYPRAQIFNLDLAEQRLKIAQKNNKKKPNNYFVCADAHALPFADQSFDLVVSNLTWHWMDHLGQAIYEAKRILKVDGTLLFTTFGPDTLRELRAAFMETSPNPHIGHFFDMHDIGDALLKAGFADPVMDVEYLFRHFKKLDNLFTMLKKTGERNYLKLRQRGLTPKKIFTKVKKRYQSFKQKNAYPATFEIVFGYAWRPEEKVSQNLNQEISIPLSTIKRKK